MVYFFFSSIFNIKVHELPPEKLKQREVVRIDISNDPVAPNDYKADEDPSKFRSKKTNRGPLTGNWIERVCFGIIVDKIRKILNRTS